MTRFLVRGFKYFSQKLFSARAHPDELEKRQQSKRLYESDQEEQTRLPPYFADRRLFVALAVLPTLIHLAWPYVTTPSASDVHRDFCAVIRVVDGDGVRLRCASRGEVNVRLYCIDAPETNQEPWGNMATAHLTQLVGSSVELAHRDQDRYGRIIGQIFSLEGIDINLRMVRDGMAVVYPQYCRDPDYYAAERAAREESSGVWAEPGYHQRPWAWRR